MTTHPTQGQAAKSSISERRETAIDGFAAASHLLGARGDRIFTRVGIGAAIATIVMLGAQIVRAVVAK